MSMRMCTRIALRKRALAQRKRALHSSSGISPTRPPTHVTCPELVDAVNKCRASTAGDVEALTSEVRSISNVLFVSNLILFMAHNPLLTLLLPVTT